METVTTTASVLPTFRTGIAIVVNAASRAICARPAAPACFARSSASARSCEEVLAKIVASALSSATMLMALTAGSASMKSWSQPGMSVSSSDRMPSATACAVALPESTSWVSTVRSISRTCSSDNSATTPATPSATNNASRERSERGKRHFAPMGRNGGPAAGVRGVWRHLSADSTDVSRSSPPSLNAAHPLLCKEARVLIIHKSGGCMRFMLRSAAVAASIIALSGAAFAGQATPAAKPAPPRSPSRPRRRRPPRLRPPAPSRSLTPPATC